MTPYHIVLADDHVLVRQGIRRVIEAAAGLRVIGEAGDGLELLELLKRLTPHLVVLDISMPNLRGIETLHEVKAIHPRLKVLVLTMHRDRRYLSEVMSAGASGYLLKEDADSHLFSAIQKIKQGGIYVSPKLVDEVTVAVIEKSRGDRRPGSEVEPLTIREREILKLTAEGKTSKEIAGLLYISSRTVEHHRANIATKLSLRGAADFVRYAMSKGYL